MAQDKPNFLWLVCEDQSLFFSIYGDSSAKTPNINALAKDGVVYQNCHTPSPVCAPSRSSLITGMYPTTLGTQHMRAYKKSATANEINPHTKLPYYSAKPKKPVRFFTEDLRANGYYCTNNAKEDYNMICSPLAWDESSKKAHWRNRVEGQAFFSVFNFNITHESKVWQNEINYSKEALENVRLPYSFPEDDGIKSDVLTNYKNIEKLDEQIGIIIDQLKADGLYDNTIIFFFSDHGGPFPHYKRSIYETGLRVPMVAKWVDDTWSGKSYQLISFVDFAPTILDVANIKREFPFEGVSFFKKDQRNYIYAATDRFDGGTDTRRSVQSKGYKLIYNGDTTSPVFRRVQYRQQMKTMRLLDSLKESQQLGTYFTNWFSKNKNRFELYEVSEDYYETNNLMSYPRYERVFKTLQKELFAWMEESDFGNLSESTMLDSMFTSEMTIPKLNVPKLIQNDKGCLIQSNNDYVSVGWRNKNERVWKIYSTNQLIQPKDDFEILLFRPGYEVLLKTFEK
ncbi:MAG: sulfatase [Cryomorphaceae bacterium]|nr:sulfatase [Cryomorphaceae bacterium]